MNDKHYPDIDTDATEKEQATQATAQVFRTTRAKIGVLAAHIVLFLSPMLAYMAMTPSEQECTSSELVCSFTPESLGLPIIAIMAIMSFLLVGVYWGVKINAR